MLYPTNHEHDVLTIFSPGLSKHPETSSRQPHRRALQSASSAPGASARYTPPAGRKYPAPCAPRFPARARKNKRKTNGSPRVCAKYTRIPFHRRLGPICNVLPAGEALGPRGDMCACLPSERDTAEPLRKHNGPGSFILYSRAARNRSAVEAADFALRW